MPISVLCPNGHKLTAKEKLAGKRVKCPKCGAAVQIPELELSELEEGLVLDESASQPQPETDWLANGQMSAATDNPLALGLGFEEHDPPTVADASSLGNAWRAPSDLPSPSASPYATVKRPVSNPPAKQGSAVKLSSTQILAIAGGGTFVGLLCVGVVGWLLFGGSPLQEIAVTDPVEPQAGVESRSSEDIPAPPQTQSDPERSPPTQTADATAPASEPQPFDLVRMKLDPRLDGFTLPGTTWAAAYDEVTGRIAITNDEKGILVYDLDEIVKGNSAPVALLPTKGLPTAVCLKPLADRRAFVIAGQDEPQLLLVDADSLQPFGKIMSSELRCAAF